MWGTLRVTLHESKANPNLDHLWTRDFLSGLRHVKNPGGSHCSLAFQAREGNMEVSWIWIEFITPVTFAFGKGWIITHILSQFLFPLCLYPPQRVTRAMVQIVVPEAAIAGLFQLHCSRNTCCLAASTPFCPGSAVLLNGLNSLKMKLHWIINTLPHIHPPKKNNF